MLAYAANGTISSADPMEIGRPASAPQTVRALPPGVAVSDWSVA